MQSTTQNTLNTKNDTVTFNGGFAINFPFQLRSSVFNLFSATDVQRLTLVWLTICVVDRVAVNLTCFVCLASSWLSQQWIVFWSWTNLLWHISSALEHKLAIRLSYKMVQCRFKIMQIFMKLMQFDVIIQTLSTSNWFPPSLAGGSLLCWY